MPAKADNQALEMEEWRQEADRLRPLAPDLQRQIIDLQRAIAADCKVPTRDRAFARRRVEALQGFLRLPPAR
jgi:hypothetical protein